MNLVYFNGAIVPADEARVSIFDRGFLYGDGVFETIRIQAGKPFRWGDHLSRLGQGLRTLGIQLAETPEALGERAAELIAANRCNDGILRITISRGPGVRGYSPRGAGPPTVVMSLHPQIFPPAAGLRLIISSVRLLADDPIARIKSANKLPHILARAEADLVGADDAILLNQRGELTETSSGNLFWIVDDFLRTPPKTSGLLPGVTRGVLLQLAAELGLQVAEVSTGSEALTRAHGVLVCNVGAGPVEVGSLDGRELQRSDRFGEIRSAFNTAVECDYGFRSR